MQLRTTGSLQSMRDKPETSLGPRVEERGTEVMQVPNL